MKTLSKALFVISLLSLQSDCTRFLRPAHVLPVETSEAKRIRYAITSADHEFSSVELRDLLERTLRMSGTSEFDTHALVAFPNWWETVLYFTGPWDKPYKSITKWKAKDCNKRLESLLETYKLIKRENGEFLVRSIPVKTQKTILEIVMQQYNS